MHAVQLSASGQSNDSADQRASQLSRQLWQLHRRLDLPQVLTRDGIRVEWSDWDRSLPFIAANYARIFEADSATGARFETAADRNRERYYRAAGDMFEFVHDGTTVGLLIGTAIDWSSYYIRTAAALPEYQGRGMIQRFFPQLFAALKDAGVARVEADTSPANLATMHLLTRMRFNVTGTVMSERWGAHVHLTKFLDEQAESQFLRQFCAGIKYQLRRGPEGATPEEPERRTP